MKVNRRRRYHHYLVTYPEPIWRYFNKKVEYGRGHFITLRGARRATRGWPGAEIFKADARFSRYVAWTKVSL